MFLFDMFMVIAYNKNWFFDIIVIVIVYNKLFCDIHGIDHMILATITFLIESRDQDTRTWFYTGFVWQ